MECSRCHDHTPILVNEGGLCWACAFPRPNDLAAQQHALADERQAAVVKAAWTSFRGSRHPRSPADGRQLAEDTQPPPRRVGPICKLGSGGRVVDGRARERVVLREAYTAALF
jgi:hypothetical protein